MQITLEYIGYILFHLKDNVALADYCSLVLHTWVAAHHHIKQELDAPLVVDAQPYMM